MLRDQDLLRRKALIAAGSVVLALGLAACDPTSDYGSDDDDWDMYGSGGTADTDDTGESDGSCDKGFDCNGIEDGEEWASCCDELADWCADKYGESTEAATECHFGPDYDGSTGCIPWGPPVPPRYQARMLA